MVVEKARRKMKTKEGVGKLFGERGSRQENTGRRKRRKKTGMRR